MSRSRVALTVGAFSAAAPLTIADIPMRAVRLQTGVSRPVYMTAAPGDNSRLFIVEQHTGRIEILNLATNTLEPNAFLTVTGLSTGNEQGLLGLAFHPNYAQNGQFYVNFTQSGTGLQVIRRYNVSTNNANLANTNSAQTVITYPDQNSNHNAGWIGFGPRDGLLYIPTGDGGSANDPENEAAQTTNFLGKVLRLNVNADDFPGDATRNYAIPRGGPNPGDPVKNPFAQGYNEAVNPVGNDEVWHYGLRNPYRTSFDRETGDLYIGDVGQNAFEEVDFQPANSPGGLHYGWRAREGFADNPGVGDADPPNDTNPILAYGRSEGFSVTGGYVYRGPENPALEGTYFYADAGTGRIWSVKYPGSGTVTGRLLHVPSSTNTRILSINGGTMSAVVSFGEDNLGRMYVAKLTTGNISTPGANDGEIFRLVPPIPGDANMDRVVNELDFNIMHANFSASATNRTWAQGDFTDDGRVNFTDFQVLEVWYGTDIPITAAIAGAPFPGAVVPEPAGLAAMLAGMTFLRRRRRVTPA